MSLDKLFGNNTELEAEKGVTLDYGDFSVTILRAGGTNTNYERVVAAKMKPFAKRKKGATSKEVMERVMAEIYAEAVIIGWDVKDAKGKPIPFTQENVVEALVKYPDFFDEIHKAASDRTLFQAEEEEEIEKN